MAEQAFLVFQGSATTAGGGFVDAPRQEIALPAALSDGIIQRRDAYKATVTTHATNQLKGTPVVEVVVKLEIRTV